MEGYIIFIDEETISQEELLMEDEEDGDRKE